MLSWKIKTFLCEITNISGDLLALRESMGMTLSYNLLLPFYKTDDINISALAEMD